MPQPILRLFFQISLIRVLLPCASQPIESPPIPAKCFVLEFLEPMGISQRELAEAIHVPYQRVNELVNQKAWCYTQHGAAIGEVFQCVGRLLAQSSIPLGFVLGANNRKRMILILFQALAMSRNWPDKRANRLTSACVCVCVCVCLCQHIQRRRIHQPQIPCHRFMRQPPR